MFKDDQIILMIMDVWGSADPVPDAKSISRRAKNLPKTGLTPNYEIRASFSLGQQQLDYQKDQIRAWYSEGKGKKSEDKTLLKENYFLSVRHTHPNMKP